MLLTIPGAVCTWETMQIGIPDTNRAVAVTSLEFRIAPEACAHLTDLDQLPMAVVSARTYPL